MFCELIPILEKYCFEIYRDQVVIFQKTILTQQGDFDLSKCTQQNLYGDLDEDNIIKIVFHVNK